MFSKRLLSVAAAAALILGLAGCSSPRLPTGKYQIDEPDREDFAVVYEDLIFLRIKSPDDAPGSLAYWEWAGKYKIEDNGVLVFDMDRETLSRWEFYFQFIRKPEGLIFNDWANQNGHQLLYQSPKLRRHPQAPRPVGSSGVNPTYQDMSRSR